MKPIFKNVDRTILLLILLAARTVQAEVKLIVPNTYLPGIAALVRVEITTATGDFDREVWDAEAILTTDQPGMSLSTNRVTLRNGLGANLVLFSGSGDFSLTATVNGQAATRTLHDASGAPVQTASGTLPDANTVWSGIIHVTGDVTVPAGRTLTIESNTWVLVDGVASGSSAPDLLISGSIQSQGTELYPVSITCASANLNWGQIRHTNAEPSTYRYTIITKAGRGAGEGHTGTAPVIRPHNSTIVFEGCTISDATSGSTTIGKIMQASGSDLTLNHCLLTRARMGPEIASSQFVCTNSYFIDLIGPDDSDGLYMHSQQAGQRLLLDHCVFGPVDDDAVDNLSSRVTFERCIMRDAFDKSISQIAGDMTINYCLMADSDKGVSIKGQGGNVDGVVRIDHTTIATRHRGIVVENKFGIASVNISYYVTNSSIRATAQPADSVLTDYDPSDIHIYYSQIGEPWPGPGNIEDDPQFVDEAVHNYRLQPTSPCIDTGDPASAPDPDGTRADMGVYPFDQSVQAPVITAQPQSQTVLEGCAARFEVVAEGASPLFYQWRMGGVDLPDETNSVLITGPVLLAQNGESYSVAVSNAASIVVSDEAILLVSLDVMPPLITAQPQSQIAPAGSTVTFSVTAVDGCISNALSYQWAFNQMVIADATNATLTISNVQAGDVGEYVAQVTDGRGNSTFSEIATLELASPPALSGPQLLPDGTFSFGWEGNAGQTYEVQASTNLVTWETIATVPFQDAIMAWTDTNAPNYNFRFYRVRLGTP